MDKNNGKKAVLLGHKYTKHVERYDAGSPALVAYRFIVTKLTKVEISESIDYLTMRNSHSTNIPKYYTFIQSFKVFECYSFLLSCICNTCNTNKSLLEIKSKLNLT